MVYRRALATSLRPKWQRRRRRSRRGERKVDISRYVGPPFGLFDENEDLRAQAIDGLSPDYLFGSYRQNQARFSFLVHDEWDVATLLRILSHEVRVAVN